MDEIQQETIGCAEVVALLRTIKEREDTDEAARLIAEHVAGCRACSAAEAQVAAVMARYHAAEATPLSDAFERRLLQAILVELCHEDNP